MTILKNCLFADFILFFVKELGLYLRNNENLYTISFNGIVLLTPMLQQAVQSLEQEDPRIDKQNEDFTLSFVKGRISNCEIKRDMWKCLLSTTPIETRKKTRISNNSNDSNLDSNASEITITETSEISSMSNISEISFDSRNSSFTNNHKENVVPKQSSSKNALYGALAGFGSFLGASAGFTALSIGVGLGLGMGIASASASLSVVTTLSILSGLIVGGAALLTPFGWGILGLAALMTISFAIGNVLINEKNFKQNNPTINVSTTPIYTTNNSLDTQLSSHNQSELMNEGQAKP